jgi:hypothetical protein
MSANLVEFELSRNWFFQLFFGAFFCWRVGVFVLLGGAQGLFPTGVRSLPSMDDDEDDMKGDGEPSASDLAKIHTVVPT